MEGQEIQVFGSQGLATTIIPEIRSAQWVSYSFDQLLASDALRPDPYVLEIDMTEVLSG